MNNKRIALVLAILLCLCMAVGASASEENSLRFSLQADAVVEQLGVAAVKTGETVTVSLRIDENPGFLVANGQIRFDNEQLELTDIQILVEDLQINQVQNYPGLVKFIYGNVEKALTEEDYPLTKTTGTVAKLTFRVLSDDDQALSITVSSNENSVLIRNTVTGKPTAATYAVTGGQVTVHAVGATHSHEGYATVEAGNGIAPTCAQAGRETDLLCGHCGQTVKTGETIPATGNHVYDMENGTVVKQATCVQDGQMCYYCVCGATFTQTVSATGVHAWDDGKITKAAGCEEDGVRTFTCGDCGKTKTEAIAAAGEHRWDDGVVTQAATRTENGTMTYTCLDCGAIKTQSIDKLPAKDYTVVIYVIGAVLILLIVGGVGIYLLRHRNRPGKY